MGAGAVIMAYMVLRPASLTTALATTNANNYSNNNGAGGRSTRFVGLRNQVSHYDG